MATCTVVGPRLILDGPLPVAPPHSLLKTEGVVKAVDGDNHVFNGATIFTRPSDVPSLWDPLDTGTTRLKDEGTDKDFPDFDPFVCYLPVTCAVFNWEVTREDSMVVLEGTYSHAVERALAGGIVGSASPWLGDTNMVVPVAGAVTAAEGLAWLENEIGKTGRQGMIHATPATVSALDQSDKVDGMEEAAGLMTANGNPVVSGGGYINIDTFDLGGPSPGEDWMFATGPVEVRLSPLVITDIKETLDRSDNTVTFRAERYVLATWDTALQAGVLVDWTS